jgi:SAM-dependent methyltransferase
MQYDKTAKDVFEAWGRDYHAEGMETAHWPRVQQIFDLIEPSSGNYLEVGIGTGYGLAHMATHQFADGYCLGIDLSVSMVAHARKRTSGLKNVDIEVSDFLTWDFDDLRFDAIFSMEVFYYFHDIHAGLHRAWSLLRPRGTLWVAVNFYEENEQSADWPKQLGTSMQRWSTHEYFKGFERAGFMEINQRKIEAPDSDGTDQSTAPTLLTFGTRP